MRKYIFLFAGLLLAQMSYAVLDVRHFGAKGDGTTLDTRAIQSAIDSAAVCGGETVVLPPGRYLSGTLVLKNNVALHIEKGLFCWVVPASMIIRNTFPIMCRT